MDAREAADGGGRGGPGGGRGGGGQAVEMNVYINPRGGVEEDYPLHAHTRDFLDKLKAKNRKTNAPMEVGYNSALPALLALEAMKENKVLGWDPVGEEIEGAVVIREARRLEDSPTSAERTTASGGSSRSRGSLCCLLVRSPLRGIAVFCLRRPAAPAREISATPTTRTRPATTRDAVARLSLMYWVASGPYL